MLLNSLNSFVFCIWWGICLSKLLQLTLLNLKLSQLCRSHETNEHKMKFRSVNENNCDKNAKMTIDPEKRWLTKKRVWVNAKAMPRQRQLSFVKMRVSIEGQKKNPVMCVAPTKCDIELTLLGSCSRCFNKRNRFQKWSCALAVSELSSECQSLAQQFCMTWIEGTIKMCDAAWTCWYLWMNVTRFITAEYPNM